VKWWWLVPVVGLLPVVVAAVLASELRLGTSTPGALVISQEVATPALVTAQAQSTPAPTPVVDVQAQATTPPATAAPAAAQAATPAPPATVQAGATTPTTPTQTSDATTGPFRAYRVQAGDTVRFVASMFGVSAASIIQASGLQDPDRIRIGQVLTIPVQPGWLYRVQPGENLDQIAARTGVPSQTIAEASQLTVASVRAGDVILIPDTAAARNK
jgi:LysM repeat protein